MYEHTHTDTGTHTAHNYVYCMWVNYKEQATLI